MYYCSYSFSEEDKINLQDYNARCSDLYIQSRHIGRQLKNITVILVQSQQISWYSSKLSTNSVSTNIDLEQDKTM